MPVEPDGFGIVIPSNWLLPDTYETVPGLDGSMTATLSIVMALAPLLVIGRVMVAVPPEPRQLAPKLEVIEPRTVLLLGF